MSSRSLEPVFVYTEGPNGIQKEPDMALGFYTELDSGMGGIRKQVVSMVLVDGVVMSIWSTSEGAKEYAEKRKEQNPDEPEPVIENWQVWAKHP